MIWQDLVVTIGTIIFIFALIPSIISKDKPAMLTSFLTAAVLSGFVVVYISFSMTFAAVANVITTLMWFTLGFQKLLQPYKSKR